jgi:hypothetical protein
VHVRLIKVLFWTKSFDIILCFPMISAETNKAKPRCFGTTGTDVSVLFTFFLVCCRSRECLLFSYEEGTIRKTHILLIVPSLWFFSNSLQSPFSSSSSSYMTMCYILSSVVLVSCDVDVQLSHQRFGRRSDVSWRCVIFCDLVYLIYIISSCSSPNSGLFYDILDLANVANSIPQSVASDAS